VSDAVRAAYAEVGLAGLELPADHDGAELGALARAIVNEELAAADAGAALALDPYGPRSTACSRSATARCSPIPRRRSLRRARARRGSTAGGARRADGAGRTPSVAWLPTCARGRRSSRSRRRAPARARGHPRAARCRRGSARGGRVRAAARVGADRRARDRAAIGALRARRARALYAASLLLGVLRDACDFSRGYALERRAFGRPIAHHQALAFLITDMQMALDGARLLVHEAAWRVDARLPCAGAAAARSRSASRRRA
jgi:alkylation response protein AidB-like acyl-CoA dehydrogenase